MCVPSGQAKAIGKRADELMGVEGVNLNNLTKLGQRQIPMVGAMEFPAIQGVQIADPTKQQGV